MDTTNVQYRVNQCSKCPRDTEYYCASCPCELFGKCKENHVQDFKTIDHNVIVYFGKFDNITNQEIYARVPSNVNGKWCELCELYDCSYCGNNLFLTNYNGDTLQYLNDLCPYIFSGSHTVSIENELTYIDMKYDIIKLSRNMKTSSTFIKRTDSNWEPRCLHCSLSTGDLIVGMHSKNTDSGKVIRYNREGQPIGTIHLDNKGLELYKKPNVITENNNRDIVVSDSWSAVVVPGGGGGYRFTYTGHPAAFSPHGICTDALSHILVCDYASATVHMLDKNGHFVSHIVSVTQESHVVSETQERFGPHSLSYDINTHHLWVGSELNKNVCVYRYIFIQDPTTGKSTTRFKM